MDWAAYNVAKKIVMEKLESLYSFMNDDILVRIGIKYSWEKEYIYSTELLMNNAEEWDKPDYDWKSDWWEGEEDIKVAWAVPVGEFENAPDEKFNI